MRAQRSDGRDHVLVAEAWCIEGCDGVANGLRRYSTAPGVVDAFSEGAYDSVKQRLAAGGRDTSNETVWRDAVTG
jgi:hypothetical protein